MHDLIAHPQLLTKRMKVNGKDVEVPASPWMGPWDEELFPMAPALDQHGESIRQEFQHKGRIKDAKLK